MADLVIVSMHEKGFPQGDLYLGHGDTPPMEFEALGLSPDAWFSLKRGQPIDAARQHAKKLWPDAKIVEADDGEDDEEE